MDNNFDMQDTDVVEPQAEVEAPSTVSLTKEFNNGAGDLGAAVTTCTTSSQEIDPLVIMKDADIPHAAALQLEEAQEHGSAASVTPSVSVVVNNATEENHNMFLAPSSDTNTTCVPTLSPGLSNNGGANINAQGTNMQGSGVNVAGGGGVMGNSFSTGALTDPAMMMNYNTNMQQAIHSLSQLQSQGLLNPALLLQLLLQQCQQQAMSNNTASGVSPSSNVMNGNQHNAWNTQGTNMSQHQQLMNSLTPLLGITNINNNSQAPVLNQGSSAQSPFPSLQLNPQTAFPQGITPTN